LNGVLEIKNARLDAPDLNLRISRLSQVIKKSKFISQIFHLQKSE